MKPLSSRSIKFIVGETLQELEDNTNKFLKDHQQDSIAGLMAYYVTIPQTKIGKKLYYYKELVINSHPLHHRRKAAPKKKK